MAVSNPFLSLFGSPEEASTYIKSNKTVVCSQENSHICTNLETNENVITLLEDVLLITTRKCDVRCPMVYMEGVILDEESVEFVLFERLLLNEPVKYLAGTNCNKINNEPCKLASRTDVIVYLGEVYSRCVKFSMKRTDCELLLEKLKKIVITNVCTALTQPELYESQDPGKQFYNLLELQLNEPVYRDFVFSVLEAAKDQNEKLLAVFKHFLQDVTQRLSQCSLTGVDPFLLQVFKFYASSVYLAPLLIEMPEEDASGKLFQQTALGTLLSISCLPANKRDVHQYFDRPSSQSQQVHNVVEQNIWTAQHNLNSYVSEIFLSLFKVSPEMKDKFLTWMEKCLTANSGRSGLWHLQMELFGDSLFVCDGFMINLASVLLQISKPFIEYVTEETCLERPILKVNPTYCKSSRDGKNAVLGSYAGNLGSQTMLIPQESLDQSAEVVFPDKYSFTTSCFFLTHRAIYLGVQVVQQKLHKISQELGRLQQQFADVSLQGIPNAEAVRNHMEVRMSQFLSLKAAAFESNMAELQFQLMAATCEWLVQLAFGHISGKNSQITYRDVTLMLLHEDEEVPHPVFQNVPEFIIENIIETVVCIKRYKQDFIPLNCISLVKRIMEFIIAFMGAPLKMNNPHLRAHLAECLETLISKSNEGNTWGFTVHKDLFTSHSLSPYLPTAITHVFVSIEMTGQSVEFEQKFNYRRPMYEVMKYLWKSVEHKTEFIRLSREALSNMETATPPLFLRFVNLLINDATFLLDEGLSYMSQIREKQYDRDRGDWAELSAVQRGEQEQNLQHMSMLARFHNMLGSSTINMLVLLTEEIPEMFTHNILVDRMAEMLNYFLCHLVGPKQRTLKVKDMEKYEFRPGETVSEICKIYRFLGRNNTFLLAVSRDGRSYTPELFKQASKVLYKIGQPQLALGIEDTGKKVNEATKSSAAEEDLTTIAPDEFLDPIMLSIMTDPIILPSSKVVCDRQTIARHLLSDQTDPFNRQPLTMEEVIPHKELKEKIKNWLKMQSSK